MEQDIKILEDLINHIRFNEPLHYEIGLYIKAMEHLIEVYKNLKEREKNYIPKSLVKEKIEELKEENYQISLNCEVAFDSGIMKNNLKIAVLEKLLEKRK